LSYIHHDKVNQLLLYHRMNEMTNQARPWQTKTLAGLTGRVVSVRESTQADQT
jgi:hypothetical protein